MRNIAPFYSNGVRCSKQSKNFRDRITIIYTYYSTVYYIVGPFYMKPSYDLPLKLTIFLILHVSIISLEDSIEMSVTCLSYIIRVMAGENCEKQAIFKLLPKIYAFMLCWCLSQKIRLYVIILRKRSFMSFFLCIFTYEVK